MGLMRSVKVLGFVLVGLACLGLTGCGGGKSFTKDDFKKVEKGMAEDKVLEITGKPYDTLELGDSKQLWWKVGDDYYCANMTKDNKVDSARGPEGKDGYMLSKGLLEMMKSKK